MDRPNFRILTSKLVKDRSSGVAAAVVADDDFEMLDMLLRDKILMPTFDNQADAFGFVEGRRRQR